MGFGWGIVGISKNRCKNCPVALPETFPGEREVGGKPNRDRMFHIEEFMHYGSINL